MRIVICCILHWIIGIFENRKQSDVRFLLMEVTKMSDRVDALENESNDETEKTKSVGAVNIEFTG